MKLTTLFIGPDGRGRDFRIRAEAPADRFSWDPAARAEANDIPLAVAGWAESGEHDMVACIPLAAGWTLVLRAANLGGTDVGYRCFANAVVVPERDMRRIKSFPFGILAFIPLPDGSPSFAAQPLDLTALSGSGLVHDWSGLGIAWTRRCVIAAAGYAAETVLGSVLESEELRTAGVQVRGWATTAALPATGDFVPSRALSLIVVAPEQSPPPPDLYPPATMTTAGFHGSQVERPLAWRLRHAINAQVSRLPQGAGLIETLPPITAMAPLEPVEQIRLTLTPLMDRLEAAPAVRLLVALAPVHDQQADGGFALIARESLGAVLARALSPDETGAVIDSLLTADETVRARLGSLGAYIMASQAFARLAIAQASATQMAKLVAREGLAEALLAHESFESLLQIMPAGNAAALCDYWMWRNAEAALPARVFAGLRLALRRLIDAGELRFATIRYGPQIATRLRSASSPEFYSQQLYLTHELLVGNSTRRTRILWPTSIDAANAVKSGTT